MKDIFTPHSLELARGTLTSSTALASVRAAVVIPTGPFVMGSGWIKKTVGGRRYLKIKFDVFRTRTGKPLYAKAWARQSDGSAFDCFAQGEDVMEAQFCLKAANDGRVNKDEPMKAIVIV